LLLAAAALSCGPSREERATKAAAVAAAGAPSSWEIVYDLETKTDWIDLYLIPAGGGAARRLAADGSLGRFTPDGRSVVFSASRRTGNRPQLWAIGEDGSHLRRLRTNDATEYQADVSPDGRQLAFLSNLDGPERLLVQDLRTLSVRELVRHGEHTIFGNPHWSPDGRRIAFSSNHRVGHQIYVVEVATGQQRRISPIAVGGCEPRFSRDGQKVVYVSRGHMRPTSRLVAHDLASDAETTLVDWPALNYDPVYSPDGSELAFASNIGGNYALYRQRLADGKAWRLTFGPGDARNPDYRPVR
ncbi:MAG TPA: hypothetical protein VEQ10_14040, partial [Vicinamibacteria bacterium]|nr:hypothetical protein [Vicinamibacteria bacterium]